MAIDRVAENLCARTQEPIMQQLINGIAKGLGEIVHAAIDEHPGIPKRPLNAVELAREAGILPRAVKAKGKALA